MKSVLVKLAALSICPCGFTVLHDEIPIGTEYRVYPETIRRGYTFACGGCGNVMHDVAVITADNRERPGGAPLPLALFDLILPFGLESAA